MTRHVLLLTLLLLTLCACGKQETAAPAPEASSSAAPPSMAETTATAPTAPSGQPAGDSGSGVAPLSPHAGLIDPQVNSQQAAGATGGIDFDLPKGWQSQKPSSSMRLAQAAIPGPGGNGDFAVFFFGPGGGGPVDANIERWVGQVDGAGKPTPETFETKGYKVTWVDSKGTLKPSGMGTGPTSPVPNGRLYGAVVEGPGGPWFFKATGPDATLGAQRDAFVGMLKSVRGKK